MAVLPMLIYMFNTIPVKSPSQFFEERNKQVLRFIWKWKGFKIATQTHTHTNFFVKKKDLSHILNSSIVTNQESIKIVWLQALVWIHRPMEKNWEPRNKPIHVWPIDFLHGCQETSMVKEWSFNRWCWDSGYPHARDTDLHHAQKLITQNGSKTSM